MKTLTPQLILINALLIQKTIKPTRLRSRYVTIFLVLAIFFSLTTLATAKIDDRTNDIILKINKAYGGENLNSAVAITLTDFNKTHLPGQSESPNQPELWRFNEILTIDFKGERKSMLSWRVSRSATDLDKFVYDGNKGRIYDILNSKYSNEDWLTYNSVGSSVVRASDTMMARSLIPMPGNVGYEGDEPYRGENHHKLRVKINSNVEYTLFINQSTGLIAKMTRLHPRAGELSYLFSNHHKKDGITFAKDMNFFVAGQLRASSVKRDIKLNPNLDHMFESEPNFTPWGETFSQPERFVKKLSDNVFFINIFPSCLHH